MSIMSSLNNPALRTTPPDLNLVAAPPFAAFRGVCDSHVHVFGPADRVPYAPGRKYTPADASVKHLQALHAQLGVERVVVVQPSPYGSDNACLMDSLQRLGSQARGVAQIDSSTTEQELDAMHQVGVCGVRLNLEVGGLNDPTFARQQVQWITKRIANHGWHLQLFTNLAVVASLHDTIKSYAVPPIVVDHFCLAQASLGTNQPGFSELISLVRSGKVWVKLSAPQRISDEPDGPDVTALARALIEANPERMLWGSDWPHPGPWPNVVRSPDAIEPFHAIDDAHALKRLARWAESPKIIRQILIDNPSRLYGFPPG